MAAQALGEALSERAVRDTAETVAGLGERVAQLGEADARPLRLPALGQADREAARVVERLVIRRHESDDGRADALLERVPALRERGEEVAARQSGEPLVAVGMARDLVPVLVDAAHLERVVIRARAGERGGADSGEGGAEIVRGEEVEYPLRARELEGAPVFRSSGAAGAIAPPLRVVVIEEEEAADVAPAVPLRVQLNALGMACVVAADALRARLNSSGRLASHAAPLRIANAALARPRSSWSVRFARDG